MTTNIPTTDIINTNFILMDTCITIRYVINRDLMTVMLEKNSGCIVMGGTRIIVTLLP